MRWFSPPSPSDAKTLPINHYPRLWLSEGTQPLGGGGQTKITTLPVRETRVSSHGGWRVFNEGQTGGGHDIVYNTSVSIFPTQILSPTRTGICKCGVYDSWQSRARPRWTLCAVWPETWLIPAPTLHIHISGMHIIAPGLWWTTSLRPAHHCVPPPPHCRRHTRVYSCLYGVIDFRLMMYGR